MCFDPFGLSTLLKEKIEKEFSFLGDIEFKQVADDYSYISGRLQYKTEKYNNYLAGFKIAECPDGSGLIVLGDTNLSQSIENKGYGVKLHRIKLEAIKETCVNFDSKPPTVIATSSINNSAQNKIFKFFNWIQHSINSTQYFWTIDLSKVEIREIKTKKII